MTRALCVAGPSQCPPLWLPQCWHHPLPGAPSLPWHLLSSALWPLPHSNASPVTDASRGGDCSPLPPAPVAPRGLLPAPARHSEAGTPPSPPPASGWGLWLRAPLSPQIHQSYPWSPPTASPRWPPLSLTGAVSIQVPCTSPLRSRLGSLQAMLLIRLDLTVLSPRPHLGGPGVGSRCLRSGPWEETLGQRFAWEAPGMGMGAGRQGTCHRGLMQPHEELCPYRPYPRPGLESALWRFGVPQVLGPHQH